MMNPKDLAQKTRDELLRTANELRADIRDFRFKVATRQHAKVRMLRNAKRDLARVLTALNRKTES
ncbi:50S ribosomal protein L29 [Candidatus Uhrbacteria bacterium]|nr:50S ribosomal protein L29 [Candidatus Uhrbacteria bacterium]